MMSITQKQLEDLAMDAQKLIPKPEVEKTVCTQEDASLKSPGVPAHYYRFLYRLTEMVKPRLSLELGTHTGISALCLAEGYPEGKVVTVDERSYLIEENKRSNIQYYIHDSLAVEDIKFEGDIDILFIDTNHDGRCAIEYDVYVKRVKHGGIVLFDDIFLFQAMRDFWKDFEPIEGHKFELPIHGKAGFGVVIINQMS